MEALIHPYDSESEEKVVGYHSVIGLLQQQLVNESQSGWDLSCIPKFDMDAIRKKDPEGTLPEVPPTYAFPAFTIPSPVNPGPKPLFPEAYFSLFADQEIVTVPKTTAIASSIIRDAIVDTIELLDFNRDLVAKFLVDLDCYWSLDTFTKLTAETRRLIEGPSPGTGSGTSWLPFLLPPSDMEDFVLRESGILDAASPHASSSPPSPSSSASLRHLLDETADLIESPTFSQVLTQLLDAAFHILLKQKLAAGAFDTPISAELRDPLVSGVSVSRAVLLPKVLSVLTRQAHAIGNGMPNEYLQAMEGVRDLEGFAAVVYSSNWQAEIAQPDGVAPAPSASKSMPASGESLKASQSSGTTALGEESMVMLDPQATYESAWERASSGA